MGSALHRFAYFPDLFRDNAGNMRVCFRLRGGVAPE